MLFSPFLFSAVASQDPKERDGAPSLSFGS